MAKITALNKIDTLDIVTLDQQVQNKCLILDIWERNAEQHRQIFVQINNLKIKSSKQDLLQFALADEMCTYWQLLETKLHDILSTFMMTKLKKMVKKEERIKMSSLIDKQCLTLKRTNDDGDTLFYNKDKELALSIDSESSFNIIVEIMNIRLDMTKNIARPDVRLRMVLENKLPLPNRIKLNDVSAFLPFEDDLPTQQQSNAQSIFQHLPHHATASYKIDDIDTDEPRSQEQINRDIEETLHKIEASEEDDNVSTVSDDNDDDINECFMGQPHSRQSMQIPSMMFAISDMLSRGMNVHQQPQTQFSQKKTKVTECDN